MTSLSVLVVDDDAAARDTLARALHRAGCRVDVTGSDHRGLSHARQLQPDVALVGPGLVEASRVAFVHELRGVCDRTTVVVFTGGVQPVALMGIPCVTDRLVECAHLDSLVRLALSLTNGHHHGYSSAQNPASAAHAAERWASVVAPVIDSPRDPKTLHAWARWVAASPGTIRNWCRTANVSPKRSLDFSRMLRAVVRHQRDCSPIEQLLDVVDRRTLIKMCGLGSSRLDTSVQVPANVDDYLRQQTWIDSEPAVTALKRFLDRAGHPRIGD